MKFGDDPVVAVSLLRFHQVCCSIKNWHLEFDCECFWNMIAVSLVLRSFLMQQFEKTREEKLKNQQREYEAQKQYREHLQVLILYEVKMLILMF